MPNNALCFKIPLHGVQTVLVDEPAGWTIALVDAPAPAPAAAEPPPEGAADIAPEDVPVAFQGAV